jgi:fumarate reductase iron-sulfur subunit
MSSAENIQTGADMQDAGMLDVAIHRGGGGRPSAIQHYQVPRQENQTVLDIVSHIQHYIDPTLSYRFACRVGMCGSCAMMVNGEPRWTCRTHIDRVVEHNSLEIAPLRNLPVIKDLVPDLDPFFDKWTKAEARHHPSASRHQPMHIQPPDSPERQRADANIECINCAVCYAACDTVANQPDYLGPAALQRAWTLLNDAKDADKEAIWQAVSGGDGCHNCHSIGSCAHYCPNELNPMTAIAGLKQQTVRQAFSLTSMLKKNRND